MVHKLVDRWAVNLEGLRDIQSAYAMAAWKGDQVADQRVYKPAGNWASGTVVSMDQEKVAVTVLVWESKLVDEMVKMRADGWVDQKGP